MNINTRLVCVAVTIMALTSLSCNVIKEIGQAVTNLSRCTFKLENISDFRLASIPLSGKTQLTLADGAQALTSFGRGELPATFTLNVAIRNPNDGTGGTSKTTATLTSLAWTLLLDDTPTISGNIPQPIDIPGTGQQSMLPLRMDVDLYRFFKEKGYDRIVKLALALGGAQGSVSRVTLRAKPTIRTSLGPLTYPGEIEILDKEFRSQ